MSGAAALDECIFGMNEVKVFHLRIDFEFLTKAGSFARSSAF